MQQQVITIHAKECDICDRYDTFMVTAADIAERINNSREGIAVQIIEHDDHNRVIYFDELGNFLGDAIAFSSESISELVNEKTIPFYIINRKNYKFIQRLKQLVTSVFKSRYMEVTVAGPTLAGKTSLVRYLRTLVPGYETQEIPTNPTMGKSIQKIKFAKASLTIFDLGGQKTYWDQWKEPIFVADAIIFIYDATSDDLESVAEAFDLVLQYRRPSTPVLVMSNKKDLFLRGHSLNYFNPADFLTMCKVNTPLTNIVSIESSIYEGRCYFKDGPVPIADVISSFLKDYCEY